LLKWKTSAKRGTREYSLVRLICTSDKCTN
jgi:hypothetical protein